MPMKQVTLTRQHRPTHLHSVSIADDLHSVSIADEADMTVVVADTTVARIDPGTNDHRIAPETIDLIDHMLHPLDDRPRQRILTSNASFAGLKVTRFSNATYS